MIPVPRNEPSLSGRTSLRSARRSFGIARAGLFSALFGFFAIVLGASTFDASAALTPRATVAKPTQSRLWPGLRSDFLIVKFVEGSQVRLEGGNLVSRAGVDIASARAVLAQRSDAQVSRLFSRPVEAIESDRAAAQDLSGRELADLNNYYALRIPNASIADAERLLDALNALPEVEIAYAEPIPQVATLGRDGGDDGRLNDVNTPNYESMQDYMDAAPLGVNAFAAWTFPGGSGQNVKIIDVEIGWNWTHEDHKAPFYQQGEVEYDDHGTAVVGEMIGQSNGFGITGIAHEASIGCHSVLGVPTADVFDQVQAALDPGDIFIIELHCPGPQATGSGQSGFIALEWWQANFDAIAIGSARGVICCEAAGNGAVNFDDAAYEGRFDRNVRDSGAVIVGAAVGTSRQPEWFTNYGARVDLHGWGSSVVTTGYGDLQGGSNNVRYTSGFSGTSSATPIVTGSVAALQGAYKAASGGTPLSPGTITQILKDTGTAQAGTKHIGPRPNLAAAIPAAINNLATVNGVVTQTGSGAPIAGADVRILETGARTTTAADGSYSLRATAGSWTLRTSHFGHSTSNLAITTTAGGTTVRNVSLNALPFGILQGVVVDGAGTPIEGATVSIESTPLPTVVTDGAGRYAITGVPSGLSGIVRATFSGLTPDRRSFVMGPSTVTRKLRLVAPIDFEASSGGFTAQTGEWQWGVPNYSEGPNALTGTRCWGTNLTGPYNAAMSHALLTGSFDLNGATDPRLTFWQWYAIWGPYDGGNVSISTNNGSTWIVIQPVGGYPDPCVDSFGANPCAPGYTNSSDGWVPAVFDLNAYVNKVVRFRFQLAPWGYTNAAGWYIDDLQVHRDGAAADVAVAGESRFYFAPPMPNPGAGNAALRFGLASPASVSVRVIGADGRLVRTLHGGTLAAGAHELTWDGQDDAGRPAASGIYFVHLLARGASGNDLYRSAQTLVRIR